MPKAYVALGLLIGEGKGVGQSDRVAADWFERAALAGDSEGQFLYALALSQGKGRPQRTSEAVNWLEKSLASNDLNAEQRRQREALKKQLQARGSGTATRASQARAPKPSRKKEKSLRP